MSKPTVAECMARIQILEDQVLRMAELINNIAQLQSAHTQVTEYRAAKQRSVQYRVDESELEARRAAMAKAKAAAMSSGHAVKV